MKAQGNPDPFLTRIQMIRPGIYDVGNLNTSADLTTIAGRLRQHPSARLCLYGPPGTGKTSFGHWLAEELGQPLLLRKASDLLNPYLGATEQMIAKTFAQATADGAVLQIDEMDSFLQDRTRAQRSWEITQVNEMLTQIESFSGILIASTNLIDHLDPASLRRFDLKIHFDYLRPEQLRRLFESYSVHLGLGSPSPDELEMAMSMPSATPGDLAAVARQHRFQPFANPSGLLEAISNELVHKSTHLRRIGFL
jgi:ATP-dependent 26S proteasome regulatory subunit